MTFRIWVACASLASAAVIRASTGGPPASRKSVNMNTVTIATITERVSSRNPPGSTGTSVTREGDVAPLSPPSVRRPARSVTASIW